MIRTISRDIFDVEELEKIETEETAKVDILKSEMPLVYFSSNINELSVFIMD